MFGRLRNLFSRQPSSTLNSRVMVAGIGNKTINIITADGSSGGFQPRIGWNKEPQTGGGRAVWLEWRTQLTALIGRDTERRDLTEWANAHHALSFKVIEAPGGVGKTRLAAEVVQSLIDTGHWAGGFVGLVDFERAQRLAWQDRWILVVDYPEHAPKQLAKLVSAAIDGLSKGSQGKLRILLLCRAEHAITALLEQQGAKSFLSDPMRLGELADTDNLALLNEAIRKLGPTHASVNQQEFQAWFVQSPLHRSALFVLALALHLSITSQQRRNRFLPAAQLLQALLEREQRRWAKAESGHGLAPGTLEDVVAFATLMGGLSVPEVNTHLKNVYAWTDSHLPNIHAALADVWPLNCLDQAYPAMAPDLLAAVFLWHWRGQLRKQGLPHDHQLLARLAVQRRPAAASLLQRWNMHAYDQTVRLALGRPQDINSLESGLMDAAKQDATFAMVLKFASTSQRAWSGLTRLLVSVSAPHELATASAENEEASASRAGELNNFAVNLAQAGDVRAALVPAQEAVDLYRRLAQANAAAYEPDLAMSLNNLANRLAEDGQLAAALVAAQEAVDLYRRLAQANAAAHEPDLAGSLNNLANFLAKNGQLAAALVAAQEAVNLYKRLTQANAAAHEPDLAMSLNNLANRLAEDGQLAAALVAAQEAVVLLERASVATPKAFEERLTIARRGRDRLL